MMHMKRMSTWVLVLLVLGGCRTAARVVEVPRVDLQVHDAGNRGFLVGTPPPAPELKTTREILEADIELPLWLARGRGQAPNITQPAVPARQAPTPGPAATVVPSAPGDYDSYVVQKGDSLWTIAAKPEIYGRATQWRRIFDANQDVLKSPNDLKAGMTLKIPRGESEFRGAVPAK